MTIPEAVYQLRPQSKLTQTDFAGKLGLSLRAYSNYERGKSTPAAAQLAGLIRYADSVHQLQIRDALVKALNRRLPGASEWMAPKLEPQPAKPFTLGVL